MVKTTAKVDGMMCGHCEAHVNDAVRRAFSVKKVVSSYAKGETEILSDSPIDEEKLREVIGSLGYKVLSVASTPVSAPVKKGFSLFSKKQQ